MSKTVSEVKFIKSSPNVASCPKMGNPEYAFVGRSNVGKSSLINYLVGINKLARTSNRPGRTRLINHFLVDKSWFLVDLPGYGYAKLSKSERSQFSNLIKDYIKNRHSLACLFLLIDCRLSPQKSDLEFLLWLGENQIPYVICFTKIDKLTSDQLKKSLIIYKQTLLKTWELLPEFFFTSIKHDRGKEEILKFIEQTNKMLKIGSSI